MNKYLIIAYWEFKEKVKKKSFIISMVITPLLILILGILPTLISTTAESTPVPVGVLDLSGKYFNDYVAKLSDQKLPDSQPQFVIMSLQSKIPGSQNILADCDKIVFDNYIEGYIVINEEDSASIEYRSNSVGNFIIISKLERVFNQVINSRILSEYGIDKKISEKILCKINLKTIRIEETGEESDADFLNTFLTAYFFIMIFIMMILFTGGMLVRSLIEEKSGRLIEILLSSCTVDDILVGKILGLTFIGLFQILIWTTIGFLFFGSGAINFSGFNNLSLQIVYFILGYLLYTALFVGAGSIATTDYEAQQISGYIAMILVIPIIVSIQVIQNPDSLLSQIFTYFPLTTVPLMILRLNISTPPLYTIISTILITIIFIILSIKVSSKIFKIGILWYGKKPSLKELKIWFTDKSQS